MGEKQSASRVIAELSHNDEVRRVERTQGNDNQVTVYMNELVGKPILQEIRENLGWSVSGISKDHEMFFMSKYR